MKKSCVLRTAALALAVFGLVFACNFPGDFCLGDEIFALMGLPAWSKGSTGTHYAAMAGLAMSLGGCIAFGATTKDMAKNSRRLIWALLGGLVLLGLLLRLLRL